jgi:hypothetical protein
VWLGDVDSADNDSERHSTGSGSAGAYEGPYREAGEPRYADLYAAADRRPRRTTRRQGPKPETKL